MAWHRDEDEAGRWKQWLGEHGAALVLYARQWSASRADAEDAMQAGFLKFWKTRGRARDEVAYLYACVRGAAMDLGRSERRRGVREGKYERVENESEFELSAERSEREAAIEAAMKELPADQREIVVMRVWGGLTFQQIAEAVGVPLQTAASRYRYALGRMEGDLAKVVGHE